MKEFWAAKHKEQDIRSLSGNGYITVFYLHLDDIFPVAHTILNIGVGMGKFEKACVQAGKVVDSMDIVPGANLCIQDTSEYFHLNVESIQANKYDLVTELLVAQHISDEEMEKHIKYALIGLKKDGVYAVQSPDYLEPVSQEEMIRMRTPKFMQGGRVCRSEQWFQRIANKYGGEVIGKRHRVWLFPEFNMGWYTYHIRRVA